MEIIGHRGSSHLAPENTLASLTLGWRETTTCELDIQATADGKLLVIHDDSTKRTTGVDLKVAGHTLSELQKLDAGAWKGTQWMGEKLPSLEQALAAIPQDKRLLIEIKTGPEVMPELVRVIRASGKTNQLLLHSFSFPVCVEARGAFPDIPVYFLIAARPDPQTGAWSPGLDETIKKVSQAGLCGLGVNNSALFDAAAVGKIHAAGLRVNVWTVDVVSDARRLVDAGVDGLITNRPGWMKEQLAAAVVLPRPAPA